MRHSVKNGLFHFYYPCIALVLFTLISGSVQGQQNPASESKTASEPITEPISSEPTEQTEPALNAENPIDRSRQSNHQEALRVSMIASKKQRDAIELLIRAIEGQLSDLNVLFSVNWIDDIDASLPKQIRYAREFSSQSNNDVVFWCDISQTDELYLYIADSDQHRILVRRLDSARMEVKFESAAVIVHSVVDAIIRGGQIGVTVQTFEKEIQPKPSIPPQKTTSPPKKQSPQRTISVEEGLHYAVRGFSSNTPILHGIGVEMTVAFPMGIYLLAGYTFTFPATIDDASGIKLRLASHPFSLGAGFGHKFGKFQLSGDLAFSGDYITQETRATATDTAEKHNNGIMIYSLIPKLSGTLFFITQLALKLSFGVQFDLTSARYISAGISNNANGIIVDTIIEQPRRVHPLGKIGLVVIF